MRGAERLRHRESFSKTVGFFISLKEELLVMAVFAIMVVCLSAGKQFSLGDQEKIFLL